MIINMLNGNSLDSNYVSSLQTILAANNNNNNNIIQANNRSVELEIYAI
jgi:hypothetical protein